MLASLPRSLPTSVLLSCLVGSGAGCDSLLGTEPAPEGKDEPTPEEPAPTDVPLEAKSDPLPPQPLVRAEHKLRFPGKAGESMGFSLDRLSKLYALAAAVEVPEWSTEGDGPSRLTRDDDLRTAWVCDPEEGRSCAIGLHFPQVSEVEIIRLYAAEPGGKVASARPSLVRVHTNEGWVEARIGDDDRPWHVVFGEPVTTRNLILEVLETHGDGPVHLAELEVYGLSGEARPPLRLDPDRTVVTFDGSPWRRKLRTHYATPSFIEEVDVHGRLQRRFPGTALVGREGDRMMLVEHTSWVTCGDRQGSYELLDLHTRVFVPLGDFGGFGRRIYPHAEGLGLGSGVLDVDDGDVHAVVLDEGRYERRASGLLGEETPTELLESWGIVPTALPRTDAHPIDAPPTGCGTARLEDLAALEPHLPKRAKIVAEQWMGCSLGGGSRLLLTTGGKCGREWHVAALDGDGELLGHLSGKEIDTHLRLRRLDGEAMLLDRWGSDDEPRVVLIDADGPRELPTAAALSLRPPAGCRKPCGTEMGDLVAK